MGQLVVAISDLKVATVPDTLVTYALGSCVGICLYDSSQKIAGLAHIMLPSSKISPNDKNALKYADTAIPLLLKKMTAQGASMQRLNAKIAGGAKMFETPATTSPNQSIWQIGQRNVDAVTEILNQLKIPIVAKDVLKNYGRTVFFDPATGVVTVKSLNNPLLNL